MPLQLSNHEHARLQHGTFIFGVISHTYFTGRPVCIGTVGVASKPVEPHPLSFAGFFIYIKRKFVANLKLIGALMWT